MKRERINLGTKEQKRAFVLNRLLSRVVGVDEAAQLLELSPRQIKRLKARYRVRGPASLVHGNQGRSPWQAIIGRPRGARPGAGQGRYAGFNHQHLTEMLAESEGLSIQADTKPPCTRRTRGISWLKATAFPK